MGEARNLCIGDLLQTLETDFTEAQFIYVESYVAMLLAKIDVTSVMPSMVCEEVLSHFQTEASFSEEMINFVGNLVLFTIWKNGLCFPLFDLTFSSIVIFLELKGERLKLQVLCKVFKQIHYA